MEKEYTISEMIQMNIPRFKPDPLSKHQYPNFHTPSPANFQSKSPLIRNSYLLPSHKVPQNHYIEQRFEPYLKAKSFKKKIFKDITRSSNCLTDRPVSSTKFKVSLLPKVPFTKEMISKFQSINSYRKLEKKPSNNLIRPCSQLACSRSSESSKSRKVILISKQRKLSDNENEALTKRKGENLSKSFDSSKKEGTLDSISSCITLLTPAYYIPRLEKNPIAMPQVQFIPLYN